MCENISDYRYNELLEEYLESLDIKVPETLKKVGKVAVLPVSFVGKKSIEAGKKVAEAVKSDTGKKAVKSAVKTVVEEKTKTQSDSIPVPVTEPSTGETKDSKNKALMVGGVVVSLLAIGTGIIIWKKSKQPK